MRPVRVGGWVVFRTKGDAMDMAQAASICVCRDCPTYFDCDEPLAFCFPALTFGYIAGLGAAEELAG